MKLRGTTAIAAVLVLVQITALAFAHTKLSDTLPRSGSVLEVSPPVIEIRFEHAVSLTSAVLVEPGKPERMLMFLPVGSAAAFKLEDPQLGPGRNEIRWTALSGDGHVVSGTLIYDIKSAPARTG